MNLNHGKWGEGMREYYNRIVSELNEGKELDVIVHELCPETSLDSIQEDLRKLREQIIEGEQTFTALQSEDLDGIIAKLQQHFWRNDMDEEEQKGYVIQLMQAICCYLDKEESGEDFYEIVTSERSGENQFQEILKEFEEDLCYEGVTCILNHKEEEIVKMDISDGKTDEKMAAAVSVYVYGKKVCPQQDITTLAGLSVGAMAESYREIAEDISVYPASKIEQKTQNRFFLVAIIVLLILIAGGGMLGAKFSIAKKLRDSLAWVLFEVTFASAAFIALYALAFVLLEIVEEKTSSETMRVEEVEAEEVEYEYDSLIDQWTNEMIDVWD